MPHYGVFECADGRHLAIGIVDENHFWRALCEVLDLGPMARLKLPVRIAAGAALRPLVARRLKRKSRAEWMARFDESGVPASVVNSPERGRAAPLDRRARDAR